MRYGNYAVLLLYLVLPVQAAASFISMATGFQVVEKEGVLTLEVKTENRGDEAAYSVQLEAETGNSQHTSSSIEKLGVNQSMNAAFSVNDAFSTPGHYPVIIKTYYKDANSYPFSALTVGFFDYQTPVVSKILVVAKDIEIPIDGKGRADFTVRNNGGSTIELSLKLYIPDELAVKEELKTITLPAKREVIVQYSIENFSALESSSYAVSLVAEYEDSGKHYSTASSIAARVTGADAVSANFLLAMLLVGVVFVGLLFLSYLRRK